MVRESSSKGATSASCADRRSGFQATLALFENIGSATTDAALTNLHTPRKPRGFLSPSSLHNILGNGRNPTDANNNTDEDDNTVLLIQQEISALQERVNSIDRANRTKNQSSERVGLHLDSSENLQELNRKLIHIQAGLVAIEGERRHLVSRCEKQEREKEQLEAKIDEKQVEIQTFRNRAVDRKREANHLREMNQELSQKVIELKMERSLTDATKQENEVLRQKLCDAEQMKLAMDEQCQTMRRSNEKAREALASCVKRLSKMGNREEEHKEEFAELQTSCHEKHEECCRLKETIKERDAKIEDLESKLKSVTEARKEDGEMLEDAVPNDGEKQEQLESLKLELEQKNAEISTLRDGFDLQMQELMSTSSELQRLQDECEQTQGLRDEVAKLEAERSKLRESLHSKETTIAEISAQLLKFDLEREYANNESHASAIGTTPRTSNGCDQGVTTTSPSPSPLLCVGLSGEASTEVEACFHRMHDTPVNSGIVTP